MITEEAIPKQRNGSFMELIRNRNFLLLWIAQIISQTAQQIINYALVIQVSDLTNSSSAVAGIIIAFTLPAIVFAAIAGVVVERNSKRAVLVVTNIARGVMVLAYVLTDAKWGAGAVLPIFYIITLLFAAVSQFFNPAELAMIPLIVRRDQLVQANSLFNLSFTACQLVGFVILGPLLLATVLHNNYSVLYMGLFALYLACAALTYFLPNDNKAETVAGRRKQGEKGGAAGMAAGAGQIAKTGLSAAKEELIEGWQFVRRDPVIINSILYWSIAITVFMMLGTIGPGFLKNVLGIDPNQLIYILMPGGLGLIIGVLIVTRIATPQNRLVMINVALFFAGLVLLIFALIEPVLTGLFSLWHRNPPLMLMLGMLGLMAFLLGLLNSFIGVPAQTALQERSTEDVRARVFSFFFTAQNVILIIPVGIAGALADNLGYPQTVALIAVAVLGIAGVGLNRLRRHPEQPAPAYLNGHGDTEEAEAEIAAEAALTAAVPPEQPFPVATGREKEKVGQKQRRS